MFRNYPNNDAKISPHFNENLGCASPLWRITGETWTPVETYLSGSKNIHMNEQFEVVKT